MKNLYLIILSTLCLIFLTGCTDKTEVNQYAYVVALGIDKSDNNKNNLAVTFEFVIPISIDSSNSSPNRQTTSITTVEAPSIHSAISLVNTYISKELNLAHNKIIVFSEDLAYEGLEDYITTISNDRNFRTNMYILISKCSAKEYIKQTNPTLEKNPSKFYEMLFNSYTYTGFSSNSYFLWHVLYAKSLYCQPVASLVNISKAISEEDSAHISVGLNKPNDSNYLAGEIKKEGSSNTEVIGMAAFRNYKQVGELTGEETVYFLIVNNTFKETYYTIYNPFSIKEKIAFKLVNKKKTDINVSFINGTPLIKIDAHLYATINSINPDIDYSNVKNLEKLENELSYIIETNMNEYLYKTSAKFNSDISGFGRYAARNFSTWEEWEKINWLDIYKYSYFDVNVDVTIRRSGLVFIE